MTDFAAVARVHARRRRTSPTDREHQDGSPVYCLTVYTTAKCSLSTDGLAVSQFAR